MIINVLDYSMVIRSDFLIRSKKLPRYHFYVDFISPEIKCVENKEDIKVSGYFYNCKSINAFFIYFEYNGIIFLAKNKNSACTIYNLTNSKFIVEVIRKYIFFKRRKCIIYSDEKSLEFFYRPNLKDEWMINTDFLENPDFFEWIFYRLENDKKNGISFPKDN